VPLITTSQPVDMGATYTLPHLSTSRTPRFNKCVNVYVAPVRGTHGKNFGEIDRALQHCIRAQALAPENETISRLRAELEQLS